MESNKENHLKIKTKIPIPVDPLPPVPTHLTIRYIKKMELEREFHATRHPLRTLSNSEAGASHQMLKESSVKADPKNVTCRKNFVDGPSHQFVRDHPTPLKIDTRHVTYRNRGEEQLDWNYAFLRDGQQIYSVTISDDEDEKKTKKFHTHTKVRRSCSLHEMTFVSAVKPATPLKPNCLEPNVIKNIKKSLKRPHSRELVGLSPGGKERKGEDGRAVRRQSRGRLCERLKSPDRCAKEYMRCLTRDYTADMFEHLLRIEQRPATELRISALTRSCVVNWLMKVNGVDGDPAVLQTAYWFLDSILSLEEVQIKKLQLVAAACYWIAQKMHRIPAPALRLVKCSDYYFTAKQLISAEMVILKTLNFPSQPVIPYEFIGYLSWWCNEQHPGEIEVSATFLCMAAVLVNKPFSADYPSVVAAAAVHNALLLLRKHDLVSKLKGCPLYRIAEAKALNFQCTLSAQRLAVRIVANPKYDYRVPFEHYGVPPLYLAQRIVKTANQLALEMVL